MIRSVLLAGTVFFGLLSSAVAQQVGQISGVPVPALPSQGRLAPQIGPLPFKLKQDVLLKASSQPQALLADPADGAIWFSATNIGAIGRIERMSGQITYFPLGNHARPIGLEQAADRSLYAVDRALNVIHKLNPQTGEAVRIAMPPDAPHLELTALKFDVNGKLWFVGAAGWLGSHDLGSGETELSSHDDLLGLSLGATGPDGSIWFVASRSGRMIHIDPKKSRFDSTALPLEIRGVRGLAVGPQGEVWLSAMKGNVLARYTGRGSWKIIALPSDYARPQALIVQKDGSVICADIGTRTLMRWRAETETFETVAALGEGGAVKAIMEVGDDFAIADAGGDRIRFFSPDTAPLN